MLIQKFLHPFHFFLLIPNLEARFEQFVLPVPTNNEFDQQTVWTFVSDFIKNSHTNVSIFYLQGSLIHELCKKVYTDRTFFSRILAEKKLKLRRGEMLGQSQIN